MMQPAFQLQGMNASQPKRIMWLLNHTTLRKSEIPQLVKLGITEIFTPKNFPCDESNLSADVSWELDKTLSIPAHELDILNQQNWYDSPSLESWTIANKYFSFVIIGFFPLQITAASKYFQGAVILRAFGLGKGFTYTDILYSTVGVSGVERLKRMGKRFWFAAAYPHLKNIEGDFLKERECYLPLGMHIKRDVSQPWTGDDPRIFFVCPRIKTSPYYERVYNKFRKDFSGFPHVVGGAQPLPVTDPNVLGFVSREAHDNNMRRLRLMFYHSTEPNHIHYHPFEAIQAGMPLLFMAGGMLDLLGGKNLPGRCRSIHEARKKARLILKGNKRFTEAVRNSQTRLLGSVREENLGHFWEVGMQKIADRLKPQARPHLTAVLKRPRIAVLLPVEYRGGTLRAAKLVAEALHVGSRQSSEDADIVFAHLDNPKLYNDKDFEDLPQDIQQRSFNWRVYDTAMAKRTLRYARHTWTPVEDTSYYVPDDGIKQFYDCDLWVVISDRLSIPLLPLRPYMAVIYDYLQRYENFLPPGNDQPYINAAHAAQRVLVTTKFTQQDAIQYAGLSLDKVKLVPMLAPKFQNTALKPSGAPSPAYFLWTTNASVHKNHFNAALALDEYYKRLNGQLQCYVTGVDTHGLLQLGTSHLQPMAQLVDSNPSLKKQIHWLGDLPDQNYQTILQNAAFLWHPARIDNGTFSVIEAARMGVPSVSSDYPAMREIDTNFGLNLCWANFDDPKDMARQLKWMEENLLEARKNLPSAQAWETTSMERQAQTYWKAVRECL
ncbi:MAG: glycosyltransferase [Alphaproteobacteria bacterium]|nr:glycosyltransferase [Alphaproteobacteria bacterium]